MKQPKLSPTPWVVDRYLVRDAEGNTIADLEHLIDLHEMPREQIDLHARLIAAAPELLTAAKECADALADIINAAGNGQPYSTDELVELFADIRCRADEAVAKATGERI